MNRPKIMPWYHAFCWLMALSNVGLCLLGIWMVRDPYPFESELFKPDLIREVGWMAVGMGAVFTVLHAAMTWLPVKPWAWVSHLINILVPLIFCCPAVICVPLLIAWMRPEVKAYYGVNH